MPASSVTLNDKADFLERDLYDALRWTFVSAVAWSAGDGRPERVLGMNTNFVQARALYEFYFARGGEPDDARARDFAPSWAEPKSHSYLKYMRRGTPANKRIFHLVYGRSAAANAGGPGHDGPDHLKNQVLEFAKDLRRITENFIGCVEPRFHTTVRTALDKALCEADKTANHYGIPNPL
jgi:hypothetical protein